MSTIDEKLKTANDNVPRVYAAGGAGIDLSEYVKFTDYASYSKAGVAKVDPVGIPGITISNDQVLTLSPATSDNIGDRTGTRAITPMNLNVAVKSALTDSKRIFDMTEAEKSNARDVIGAEQKTTIVPWVSTLTEMSVIIPSSTKFEQICDHDITAITLDVTSQVPVGYECSFTFQSGATATTITYSAAFFKFVGVDCDADGDFVASANTNYEVSIRNMSTNTNSPLLVARVGVY